MIIYEPKGKAREYSPLAVNLYSGCGHKCSYCYVPRVLKITRSQFDNEVKAREDILKKLESSCRTHKNSKDQVFMSFTTDPYNPIDEEMQLTREALKLFYKYQIPVSILTKSGTKALRDLDIFKMFGSNIKVGTSLTYDNAEDTKNKEAGAALPEERIQMLGKLWFAGIRTWISLEPIIEPEQTLNLLNMALPYVNEIQIGKLANDNRKFDWNNFLQKAVNRMRELHKPFYIKETLRQAASSVELSENEKSIDYLTLKNNF